MRGVLSACAVLFLSVVRPQTCAAQAQGLCAQTPACTSGCLPGSVGSQLAPRDTAYNVCFDGSVAQNFTTSSSMQSGATTAANN
jgi:hypothetical protein